MNTCSFGMPTIVNITSFHSGSAKVVTTLPSNPWPNQTCKECRSSFNNNSWSLSIDEGNLIGCFSDGTTITFGENRRIGKLVGKMQLVVLYDSDCCHLNCAAAQRNKHGHLIMSNDPIKQGYYLGNEDDDECDDPYKDLAFTRKIEQKRRRHLKETGEFVLESSCCRPWTQIKPTGGGPCRKQ
jgi:hypothetical protein